MKKLHPIILFFLFISLLLSACTPATSPPSNTPQADENNPTPTIASTAFPAASAGTIEPGQHPHSYLASTGEEIRYLLYMPENYDSKTDWPLIVFLHGAGAHGTNIDLLTSERGLPFLLEDDPDFEFIVLSPQLPSGRWGKYIDPVDELVVHLSDTLSIDTSRLYLTGLSLGGLGAWQYALDYPDRFAALAPVAGAASVSSSSDPVPDNICSLSNLPVWIFHGEEDISISPDLNEAVVSELEACGGNVKFTLYPGTNHMETFPLTYADPALYAWFLEQTN